MKTFTKTLILVDQGGMSNGLVQISMNESQFNNMKSAYHAINTLKDGVAGLEASFSRVVEEPSNFKEGDPVDFSALGKYPARLGSADGLLHGDGSITVDFPFDDVPGFLVSVPDLELSEIADFFGLSLNLSDPKAAASIETREPTIESVVLSRIISDMFADDDTIDVIGNDEVNAFEGRFQKTEFDTDGSLIITVSDADDNLFQLALDEVDIDFSQLVSR